MITIRPFKDADRFLVRRWLDDPALPSWWGTKSSVEATITYAQEMTSPLMCMIERDGTPVGFALGADSAIWGEDFPRSIEAGSWTVNIFVSQSAARVPETADALAQVVEEILATKLAISCCSLVSIKNEAAARAFEKAGFKWSEIWHDPYSGPCWVMHLPRLQ